MSTLRELIKNSTSKPYRRAWMKRLQNNGTYESDWYDITKYVTRWGSIRLGYGDQTFLGEYQIDGYDIELNNIDRKFSRERDPDSLFFGYRTRYRTKFKIEAGYMYIDGETEVPAITFYGILYSNSQTGSNGVTKLSIAPMIKVFENYKAIGIDTSSGTTADLVERLAKLEINGERVFDQYFEGTTDAQRYKINPRSKSVSTIATPDIQDNDTVWDKMTDYSIYDDFFVYVDNDGSLVFDSKEYGTPDTEMDILIDEDGNPIVDENMDAILAYSAFTDTVAWKFNGAGTFDNEYGINITSDQELIVEEDIKNLWTRIVIEYDSDTFATSEQAWNPGDESISDIYGERQFSESYHELAQAEAQAMANKLRNRYGAIYDKYTFATTFIPQLTITNLCDINYTGLITPSVDMGLIRDDLVDETGGAIVDSTGDAIYGVVGTSSGNVFILNQSLLGGGDVLGRVISPVNLVHAKAKIVEYNVDLDNYTCDFTLRGV